MKTVYLYLCDSEKAILNGKCNGTMCRDVEFETCCRHTSDLNYAKFNKPFKDRSFDKFCFEDDEGNELLTYWEIDPRDLS